MLDIIALILAGVSLVVSIGIARSDRKVEIKIAKTGIMAQYFDEIYKDFLIERIPRAREQMRFDMENKLQHIDPLVNELVAIRKKSLYFCYSNPTFYSDLVRRLSALEDYLIRAEGKTFIGEDHTAFCMQIKSDIESIYQLIIDHHQGNL